MSDIESTIIANTATEGYIVLGTVIRITGADQLVVTDANSDAVDLAEFVASGTDAKAAYEPANNWLQLTVTKDISGWNFDGEA